MKPRNVDGRYKNNVDKGVMSFQNIILPIKQKKDIIQIIDDTPKQILRQKQAKIINSKKVK